MRCLWVCHVHVFCKINKWPCVIRLKIEFSTEVLIVRDKERATKRWLISDEIRWLKGKQTISGFQNRKSYFRGKTDVQIAQERVYWVYEELSRSPPTVRCRPARRRSPQGRSGATVDEHGLRFYGFLSETMECGVRAAASYISCRYQSLSQRGLSCRMLLVSMPLLLLLLLIKHWFRVTPSQ